MLLPVACGKEESRPGSTPAAAVTTTANVVLGPGEGLLPVRGGRIWYRVSGTGRGTPMVLLHGGPGAGSYYLKAFEDIGDDRPVVRYDQLGAGKSDRLTDTTLMNIPRFVEELDSLRRALKIDKWFVNGHSWGTVLAAGDRCLEAGRKPRRAWVQGRDGRVLCEIRVAATSEGGS